MFTTLMPGPKQQFFDNNGLPLVGGSVTTYDAGTSNPRATYTDEAGTVPQPNPIPLNARGEPTNAIRWIGSYKVIVKDSLGNVVYTVDGFQTPPSADALAAAGGAGMTGFNYATVYSLGTLGRWLTDLALGTGSTFIGFLQAGAGSLLRTLQAKARDVIDAADYINIPGASNVLDQAGIQLAINQAAARGGGRVRVRAPISAAWDFSLLTVPDSVMIDDERYSYAGHTVDFGTGTDREFRVVGKSLTSGEGPAIVLQNTATAGDRTSSIASRWGIGAGANVGMYMHFGVWDGANWFPEYDMIASGADGFRSQFRVGYGTAQVNAAYTGAFQYTQNKMFTVNKPPALGGGPLLEVGTTITKVLGELRVSSANAPIRHAYADGTLTWSWLDQFPAASQLTLFDHNTSTNKLVFTSAGDTIHLGTFKPSTDNTVNLGSAANRWGTVYAGTGAINTSDENQKTAIQELDPALLRAAAKINICQFKFKDAVSEKGDDGARWHFGVIAQQVKDAFESEGLDPFAFGLLCYDKWGDEFQTVQVNAGERVKVMRMVERHKTKRMQVTTRGTRMVDGHLVHIEEDEEYDEPLFEQVHVLDDQGRQVMVIDQPAVAEKRGLFGKIVTPGKKATFKPLMRTAPVMESVEMEVEEDADPVFDTVQTQVAGDRYGVRYDELFALKIAALTNQSPT